MFPLKKSKKRRRAPHKDDIAISRRTREIREVALELLRLVSLSIAFSAVFLAAHSQCYSPSVAMNVNICTVCVCHTVYVMTD